MKKKLLRSIILLSLLGVLISIYLLILHYQDGQQICDINDALSCTQVKESSYAQLLGFPIALYGIIGYLILGIMSIMMLLRVRILRNRYWRKAINDENLFYLAFVALLFSLYLTYAEIFLIKSLCIFCLFSAVIIAAITILSYKHLKLKPLE